MRSNFDPLQPRGWHGRWILAGLNSRVSGQRVKSRAGKIYRGARTKGFFPIASVQRTGIAISGAGVGVGYGHKLTPSFRGSIQVTAKIDRTRQSRHNAFFMKAVNSRLAGIKNPQVRTVVKMIALGGEHDLDGQTGIVATMHKPQPQTIKLVNGQQYAQARRKSQYGNRNSHGVGTGLTHRELEPGVTPKTITGAKGAAKKATRPQRRGQKSIDSSPTVTGQKTIGTGQKAIPSGKKARKGRRSITKAHTTVTTPHGQKRRKARGKGKSGGTFTK